MGLGRQQLAPEGLGRQAVLHQGADPALGAGVLEVVEDFQGDAYRAVYTVRYVESVYVVHCFQKKSTQGIATPKPDVELIKTRLKAIEVSLGVRK